VRLKANKQTNKQTNKISLTWHKSSLILAVFFFKESALSLQTGHNQKKNANTGWSFKVFSIAVFPRSAD
jgi:hypothetical protein